MWITNRTTILLALLASTTLCTRPAGGSDEWIQKMPDSRRAHAAIRIAADPAVVPLDVDTLELLVRSDAVAGEAARTVLNAKYDALAGSINIRTWNEPPQPQSLVVTPIRSGAQLTYLPLAVDLPDRVKPKAWQFAGALVENLKRELEKAFNAEAESIEVQLKRARDEQDAARTALSEAMKQAISQDIAEVRLDSADADVYRQLDKVVSLSALDPQTPFADAIETIRRSVEPPMQIVVLWRELRENAQIEPTTPINMQGPVVRLGKGIRTLLDAMSNPQLGIHLGYVVDADVITIGTEASLPKKQMETRVHEVPALLRTAGRTDGLAELIEQTVEPESWLGLSERGEGTVTLSGTKLIVWQTSEVHKKIVELLRTMAVDYPVAMPVDAPKEALEQQMQSLLAYRSTLDQEIDRLQDRQAALSRRQDEAERQTIENCLRTTSTELYRTIGDLESIRTRILVMAQDSNDAAAILRAVERIKQCADVCGRSMPKPQGGFDGGSQASLDRALFPPSGMDEAQTLSMRLAAKQGELGQVARRIARIHDALTGQTTLDLEVHNVQLAAKRLEKADLRVQQLQRQIVALSPCSVTLFPPVR